MIWSMAVWEYWHGGKMATRLTSKQLCCNLPCLSFPLTLSTHQDVNPTGSIAAWWIFVDMAPIGILPGRINRCILLDILGLPTAFITCVIYLCVCVRERECVYSTVLCWAFLLHGTVGMCDRFNDVSWRCCLFDKDVWYWKDILWVDGKSIQLLYCIKYYIYIYTYIYINT